MRYSDRKRAFAHIPEGINRLIVDLKVRNLYGLAPVATALQVERLRDTVEADLFQIPPEARTVNGLDTWILTERHLTEEYEVMGVTRILATTHELKHADLHKIMRGYRWSLGYLAVPGPTHCGLGPDPTRWSDEMEPEPPCSEGVHDAVWQRDVLVPALRKRYGL